MRFDDTGKSRITLETRADLHLVQWIAARADTHEEPMGPVEDFVHRTACQLGYRGIQRFIEARYANRRLQNPRAELARQLASEVFINTISYDSLPMSIDAELANYTIEQTRQFIAKPSAYVNTDTRSGLETIKSAVALIQAAPPISQMQSAV